MADFKYILIGLLMIGAALFSYYPYNFYFGANAYLDLDFYSFIYELGLYFFGTVTIVTGIVR